MHTPPLVFLKDIQVKVVQERIKKSSRAKCTFLTDIKRSSSSSSTHYTYLSVLWYFLCNVYFSKHEGPCWHTHDPQREWFMSPRYYKQVINNLLPVQKIRFTREMLAGRPEPHSWFSPMWDQRLINVIRTSPGGGARPSMTGRTVLHTSPSPPQWRRKDCSHLDRRCQSGQDWMFGGVRARKRGSLFFLSVNRSKGKSCD